MESRVQYNVVSVDTTVAGSQGEFRKGVWIRPDGTRHEVSIIDKKSLGKLGRVSLKVDRKLLSVDTGDHIITIEKRRIKHVEHGDSRELRAAFCALGKKEMPVRIVEDLRPDQFEALMVHDGVQELDGRSYLISGKKSPDMHTSHARRLHVQLDERGDRPTLEKIQAILWSGQRGVGETSKPAMSDLLARAEEKGEASMLVSIEDKKLCRARIVKNADRSFTLSFTEASISFDEAKEAGLSSQEASYLQKSGGEILARVFHAAIQSNQAKKKADYILRPEKGVYDWTRRVIVHLRVKQDGTVTLGISSFLAEGSFKYVRKMVRFGASIKFYAEAGLKRGSEETLHEEARSLSRYAHHNIVQLRKEYERQIPTIDEARTDTTMVRQVGIRTVLCEQGTARSFTQAPCRPKSKECLERLNLAFDAARGLAFLHAKKVYYMDFKSGNLLVTGNPPEGRLCDLSPKEEGALALTTPQYADFEANQHCMAGMGKPPADPANDVWALGLFLFELMYGEAANPFAHSKLQLRERAVFEQAHRELFAKLDNTPADGLIRAMLTLKREDRPQLDEQFLAFFQQQITLYQTKTPRVSTLERTPSPRPSTPSLDGSQKLSQKSSPVGESSPLRSST